MIPAIRRSILPDIWTEVCGKAGACRFLVGGDAYIAPLESYEFAENFRKSGLCRRVDVGIDTYTYVRAYTLVKTMLGG